MTDIEIIALQAKEIIVLKAHKAELLKRTKDAETELRDTKEWFDQVQEGIKYWGHYAHTLEFINHKYTRNET